MSGFRCVLSVCSEWFSLGCYGVLSGFQCVVRVF